MNIKKSSVGVLAMASLLLAPIVLAATAPSITSVTGPISGYASSTTQVSVVVDFLATTDAALGDTIGIYNELGQQIGATTTIGISEMTASSTTFNFSGSQLGSDGAHAIFAIINTVASVDGVSAITSPITVDTVAPTITLDVAVPALTNDSTPDFQFHTDENGTILYAGGCTSVTSSISVPTPTTITLNTLTDGTYGSCTVTVVDAAGNASTPLALPSFVVDTTAPVASITYSLNHAIKSGTVIRASVALTEAIVGSLEYHVSGFTSATTSMVMEDVTHYYADITGGTGDGTASITFDTATDAAGNLITAVPISGPSFVVDNTAPALPTITSVATDNKVNAGEAAGIVVVGTAEANSTTTVAITDGTNTVTKDTLTDGSGNYSATLNGTTANTAKLADGGLLVTALATDQAGNSGSTLTYGTPVTQNTAVPLPPTPTLTSPINNTGSTTVSLTGTAQGNTTLYYSISDGTRYLTGTTAVSGGNTFSVNNLDLSSFTDGSITATTTATDSVGNISNIGSATPATKDTVGPVFSSIAPADNAYIKDVTSSSQINYALNEALISGTAVFTRTAGTADGSSPHICALKGTALTSGAHTLDLSDTTNSCTSGQTLVSGTVYSIAFSGTDAAGNAGLTYTNTSVTFDNTAPTLTLISVRSNNASTTLAKAGDIITITATSSEALASVAGTISGRVATVTSTADPLVYTLTATIVTGDAFTFSINVADLAGNTNTASAINDGPTVVIDTTAPTASLAYSLSRAVNAGTLLTITATVSEPIADATGLQLALSGIYAIGPAPMDKIDETHYATTTLIGFGDGTQTVALSAGADLAGNSITSAPTAGATFVVDNTAPTPLSLTSPTSPTNDSTPTVTLGSGEDGTLTYSGCYSGTPSVTAPSASITYSTLSDGTHTCEIGVTDVAGNIASTTSTSFTVDTTAPSSTYAPVVSAGPLINSTEQSAGVTVTVALNPATTSPAVAGDTIELLLNDSSFGTPITHVLTGPEIAANSVSLTIASGQLGADGAKSLTARITDLASNIGTLSGSTSIALDTLAPAAPTFTSTAGDNKVNAAEFSRITILGTAEANASVLLSMSDSVSVTKSTTTTASADGAISDYINGSSATAFTDGALTLTLTATDIAGNTGLPTTVALLLDSTPPSAPLLSFPAPGYINRAASTTVPVSIIGEGLTSANYILSNGGLATSSAKANVVTTGVAILPNADSSMLPDGTVTVEVALTDGVGNVSATTTATISKDTVLPIFSSVTPANNAYTNNITTSSSIGFTNSKALTSGAVVFTRTGGTADAGSPRTCSLAGTALANGIHTLDLSDTVNGCATAVTLTDGSIYTIAIDGQDNFANPALTVTVSNVTYDVTPPVVSIYDPIEGITIATTTTLTAGTNETTTACYYVLDGNQTFLKGIDITHSDVLQNVAAGAHSVTFTCDDLAGNTATSTTRGFTALATSGSSVTGGTGPVVFGGTSAGQINLPTSIINLDLNNESPLYASTSLSSVVLNNLMLGGVSTALNGGVVAGIDLTLPQTVGDQTITIGTGYRLVSGVSGEPIMLSNSSLTGATLSIPDSTDVMGSATWDGRLFGPTSGSASGNAPADYTVGDAVMFGSDSSIILFSQPATILLNTSKPVVMKVTGSSTWVTPATCLGSFTSPTAPTAFGECMIANTGGTQVKILTYHLTTFGTLTAIPPAQPVPTTGNGPITGALTGGIPARGGNGSVSGSVITPPASVVTTPKIPLTIPASSARTTAALRTAQIAKIQLQIAALRKEYVLALERERISATNLAQNPVNKPTDIAKVKPKVDLPVANLGSLLNQEKATSTSVKPNSTSTSKSGQTKATTTKKSSGFWSIFGF